MFRARDSTALRLPAQTALVCLLAAFTGAAAPGATLIVGSAADAVNGNVSSPAALVASPGPDGISLREAILAVGSVPGPHRITFSGGLMDETLALSSPLPFVTRDDTQILGLRRPDGRPGFTLDGAAITVCCGFAHLTIAASRVSVERLRFTNVIPDNRALRVLVGPAFGQPSGPPSIADVRIEDNEFDNAPRSTDAYAVTVGADGGTTTLRRVTIAGNVFRHFQGDGTTVQLPLHGSEHGLIEDVAITDNTFTECTFSVELVNVMGSHNTIRRTRIERNLFERGREATVTMGNEGRPDAPPSTDNLIADTVIAGNRFVGGTWWAIILNGGQASGNGSAERNTIADTWIVNNVITGTLAPQHPGAVLLLGGSEGGTNNQVTGVQVLHDTIAFNDGVGLTIAQQTGGTGNRVTGVEIRNCVFWENQPDLGPEIQPEQVDHTLTSVPGLAGVNGNVAADPRFADPAADDFELQAGSLAIDAGTSEAAVRVDADGHGRLDDPSMVNSGGGALPFVDMGAFEHVPPTGGLPCAPLPEVLCLAGSRFRVEADWETAPGERGNGHAVALTNDAGYLWFFASANVEAVVKLLDACAFNQRYWVFAAGLTDVATLLTVTDTRSGLARQYVNPQGLAFRPLQDTDAFATCDSLQDGHRSAGATLTTFPAE